MLCLLPLDQLEDIQEQGLVDGPCVGRLHTFELLVETLLMNCCIVIDWLGDIVIFAKREKYFAVELDEFLTLIEFGILEASAKSDEVGDDGVAELIVFSFEEVDDEVEKAIVCLKLRFLLSDDSLEAGGSRELNLNLVLIEVIKDIARVQDLA